MILAVVKDVGFGEELKQEDQVRGIAEVQVKDHGSWNNRGG